MANAVNRAIVGTLTDVQTVQSNPLGMRVQDNLGNEYVYAAGVASTVAGSWVTFGQNYATTLVLDTTGTGAVGVAQAAIVANTFGWFQVKGFSAIALAGSTGTIVSGAGELKCATAAGLVVLGTGDSFGVTDAGHIYGAWSYSAQPVSSGAGADIISVYLNYPFIQRLAASV